MAVRNSEIRSYLLRFAAKNGIRVSEHVTDEQWQKICFFCHLESGEDEKKKTATAVSHEGHDNALVMAFLSFFNPNCNFLDLEE